MASLCGGTAVRWRIVCGPDAPPLEQLASEELQRYLHRLYGWQVPMVRGGPTEGAVVLLGRPDTHPAMTDALMGRAWPRLSNQGFVLRTVRQRDGPRLVVGGRSPEAVLWAVYELVERLGVRYLLHGDVMPERPPSFPPDGMDVALEPTFPIRWWRTVNDFAMGPESWGMADHRPVLDQLAKLKFNRVFLSFWPWQPFLDLEVRGIRRTRARLWFGYRYPITEDMPGRSLFGEELEFWNPDLPREGSYEELTEAAQELAHHIMAYARSRGMRCGVTASLLDFPREFAPLLQDARPVHQLEELTIVPGPDQDLEAPGLTELAVTVVQATVRTYPEADFLMVGMPEWRQWAGQYERAWRELDARYGVERALPLAEVLQRAARRSSYPGGAERAVQEAKGDIVGLCFYDRIFRQMEALRDTPRPDVHLVYMAISEELFPVLDRVLPPGSELLNCIDYTTSRVLRRREVLRHLPAHTLPSCHVLTLHDDNVGVLPQLTTSSTVELLGALRAEGWSGYSTRYWLLGDHDLCVATIARSAWDEQTTREGVYRDYLHALCGEEAVADMMEVLAEVERVTLGLEDHGLGLTFPIPDMMRRHWTAGSMPPELIEDREGYRRALVSAQRALGKAEPSGRTFVEYWMGRLAFGIGYLDAMERVCRAATLEAEARKAWEQDDGVTYHRCIEEGKREVKMALETARHAIEAYARVACDRSDLGAIATMGEYVYRVLKEKLELGVSW